jgi:ribosomal protein S18 acetylase RimI-like enzyme
VGVDVATLAETELPDATGVLARGMRDNPLHIAAFGDEADHRVDSLTRMFNGVMPMQPEPLRASADGKVVGVCGFGAPPECMVHMFGELSADQFPSSFEDAGEQGRVVEWLQAWGKRDPGEPHFHLGPVAADAGRQGQGIGSAMMQAFCDRVDRDGALAYLETDKAENVGFYEKFGFETVGEAPVIGVTNWFMHRAAK